MRLLIYLCFSYFLNTHKHTHTQGNPICCSQTSFLFPFLPISPLLTQMLPDVSTEEGSLLEKSAQSHVVVPEVSVGIAGYSQIMLCGL